MHLRTKSDRRFAKYTLTTVISTRKTWETEHENSDEAYLADTDATGNVVNIPALLTANGTQGFKSFFEHLRKLHEQDVARDDGSPESEEDHRTSPRSNTS